MILLIILGIIAYILIGFATGVIFFRQLVPRSPSYGDVGIGVRLWAAGIFWPVVALVITIILIAVKTANALSVPSANPYYALIKKVNSGHIRRKGIWEK